MLFDSFHSMIKRLTVTRRALMCGDFSFVYCFFQTFSSKVFRYSHRSWRTNCTSLMRKKEAWVMSTSRLCGGKNLCKISSTSVIGMHSSRNHRDSERNAYQSGEWLSVPESTASGCLLTVAGGTKPREAGESSAVDVSEQQKKPRQSGVGAGEQQLCGSQTQFAQPSSHTK